MDQEIENNQTAEIQLMCITIPELDHDISGFHIESAPVKKLTWIVCKVLANIKCLKRLRTSTHGT